MEQGGQAKETGFCIGPTASFTVVRGESVLGLSSDLTFVPPNYNVFWSNFQNFIFDIFIIIYIAHNRKRERTT